MLCYSYHPSSSSFIINSINSSPCDRIGIDPWHYFHRKVKTSARYQVIRCGRENLEWQIEIHKRPWLKTFSWKRGCWRENHLLRMIPTSDQRSSSRPAKPQIRVWKVPLSTLRKLDHHQRDKTTSVLSESLVKQNALSLSTSEVVRVQSGLLTTGVKCLWGRMRKSVEEPP